MMSILLLALALAISVQVVLFIPAFLLKTDKLTDLSYSATFILVGGWLLAANPISPGKIVLFAMVTAWASRLGLFLFTRIRRTGRDRRFDGIRRIRSSSAASGSCRASACGSSC